ncbi:MAG: hypothetical protein R3D88_09615 [Alphaproteobacteria bacterium]
MFSQLGPLFKTTFRQAESNDTRQAIPHEEKDKGQKKRGEENKKETDGEAWVDNTSVSVGALRAFLINFLKTAPETQNSDIINPSTPQNTYSQRPPETKRPTSTKNAKAVRAYQSMAAKARQDNPPPVEEENERRKLTVNDIESKELRDIYNLIDDLDKIANKGVETLNIQKADTFVEALKNAVTLAKSKI